MKNSKTLRRQHADVEAFASTLRRFIKSVESGREPEASALYDEVNHKAGSAAYALQSVGMCVAWKPPGQPPGYSQNVNPAQSWTTILEPFPMFGPDVILAVCDQTMGALSSQAMEAEEHEQSFEGKVAHAAGFLDRVRPHRRSHRAGVVQGVAGTVVGGLIVGYVLHVLGWV